LTRAEAVLKAAQADAKQTAERDAETPADATRAAHDDIDDDAGVGIFGETEVIYDEDDSDDMIDADDISDASDSDSMVDADGIRIASDSDSMVDFDDSDGMITADADGGVETDEDEDEDDDDSDDASNGSISEEDSEETEVSSTALERQRKAEEIKVKLRAMLPNGIRAPGNKPAGAYHP